MITAHTQGFCPVKSNSYEFAETSVVCIIISLNSTYGSGGAMLKVTAFEYEIQVLCASLQSSTAHITGELPCLKVTAFEYEV